MGEFLTNSELLYNILATIIGGLVLTLILFLLNEQIFPKMNITGGWVTKIKILNTKYKPFENLSIEYIIHLLQKGNEIIGSGEKVKDINPDGTETVFELEKRVRIEIKGYYQKKYFSPSKIYLNICEEGRKRESRYTYVLTLKRKNKVSGTFISTAANAQGVVELFKI